MKNGRTDTDRIAAAYNVISRSINPRQMLNIQLTTPQIKVLMGFAEHELLSMGSLSRMHGVTVSTMTSVVSRLIDAKLLRRQAHDGDRRIVQIGLTERGRKMTADLFKARRQALKRFLGRLTAVEAKKFVSSIEYVADCLSEARDKAKIKNGSK